jgi:hypothetical protein
MVIVRIVILVRVEKSDNPNLYHSTMDQWLRTNPGPRLIQILILSPTKNSWNHDMEFIEYIF